MELRACREPATGFFCFDAGYKIEEDSIIEKMKYLAVQKQHLK